MALECNIDSRGKAFRLKYGIIGVAAGIICSIALVIAGFGFGPIWIVPAGAIGGGSFAIFEGWSGWCAARALGIKTPI